MTQPTTPQPQAHGPARVVFRNVAVNFGGQGVVFVVSLLVVPLYIHLMGIEAYGLVGFYMLLQTTLRLLDLGLSPAVNRQMARYASHGHQQELWDFVRTFEPIFFGLGLISALALAAATPWIVDHWLDTRLPPDTVRSVLWVMAALCGLQWPIGFYHGVMLGLERHDVFNTVRAVEAVVTAGAAVATLMFVGASATRFFLVLLVAAVVFTVIYRLAARRCMPARTHLPRFRPELIRLVSRFAGGMLAITATAIVLTQLHKIILSKTVMLEVFGYYSLASVAAGVLIGQIVTPIFSTIFPRCSALTAVGDEVGLIRLYHTSTQALAVLLAPATIALGLFAEPLLAVWTRDPVTASHAAMPLRLLAIGNAFNGLMNPTYALQLAAGWMRLPVAINLSLIVFTLPALLLLVPTGGATACAAIWAASMAAYVLIGVPLTHRRLLRGQAVAWFARDVIPPLAAAAVVLGMVRWVGGPLPPTWRSVILIGAAGVVAVVAAGLTTAQLRREVFAMLARIGSRRPQSV